MKKLFLISAICCLGQVSFAQTNVQAHKRTDPTNEPKFLELKKQHNSVAVKNTQSIESVEYFGYAETLKSFFSNGIIPKEAPKSDGTLSKEQYVKVLNDWVSKNQYLLKPEHKNSLIK